MDVPLHSFRIERPSERTFVLEPASLALVELPAGLFITAVCGSQGRSHARFHYGKLAGLNVPTFKRSNGVWLKADGCGLTGSREKT